MYVFPYSKEPYDEGLKYLASMIKEGLSKNNKDDFLLVIVGGTNTGKSSLMLHLYEEISGGDVDCDLVAWDQEGFANALKKNRSIDPDEKIRFLGYDEGNVSGRNAMTKWNKDLIDLYLAIRQYRIFHVWCNPSADMLDKPFIEGIVKGLIFLKDKTPHIRRYYYFSKEKLLSFYKDQKLSLYNLNKFKKKYASFRGWYKKYDGQLWKNYNINKESRMEKKIDYIYDTYGKYEDFIRSGDMSKKIGISASTIIKYAKKLTDEGFLTSDQCKLTATGYWVFKPSLAETFLDYAQKLRQGVIEKTAKNLEKGRMKRDKK